jgi:uncharacterized protein YgiB involved in biofilm formation
MRPMIRRLFKLLLIALTAAGLALTVSACGSACGDLARKICKCQPTRAKEDACKLATDSAKRNFDPSNSEEKACEQILSSGNCTCEALAAGDLAACGLANDATNIYE